MTNPALSSQLKSPTKQNTYILALSACPPWKKPQFHKMLLKYGVVDIKHANKSCANSVNLMVKALKKRYSVPEKNIITLVDQKATISKINSSIAYLRKHLTKNDRLILYSLLHASDVKIENGNYEMLFLWSQHFPSAQSYLEKNQEAVLASGLYRRLEHEIQGRKIIILDACHSGIAQRYNFYRDTILITSALPNQFANYTKDYRYALFTKLFADKLLAASSTTPLHGIFISAKKETEKESNQICKFNKKMKTPYSTFACDQSPLYSGSRSEL